MSNSVDSDETAHYEPVKFTVRVPIANIYHKIYGIMFTI